MTQQPKSKDEQAKEYTNQQGVSYPLAVSYKEMIASQIKAAFIAGWDAASKRVGNVWVKASERLPTVAGNYYCNVHYNTHRGFDEKDVKYFDGKHFPGDHQQPSLIPAIEWLDESTTPSLAEENRRLREAAKELLHLHSCEQEGLQSGKPTFEMWFNAVNKLSEAIAGDAGNKEE